MSAGAGRAAASAVCAALDQLKARDAMNTLVPRVFDDLGHGLDTDLSVRSGHRIHVEESAALDEYAAMAQTIWP